MSLVSLFGLTIESDIPLPAPTVDHGPADVTIRIGTVPETLDRTLLAGPAFASNEEVVLLRVDRVARFLVRHASEVIVEPSPGAEASWILHPLLSSVMGVVMQRRGALTLHASAVGVGKAGVVFAGSSGSGKSTLAAYLARLGHPLLSDGFVAIIDTETIPKVLVGPAALKLWPDAAHCLGLDGQSQRLAPAHEKRLIAQPWSIAKEPVPIARIYVLGSSITMSRGRTRGSQRLRDLAGHCFMPSVGGAAGEQATKLLYLVRHSTVGRLARPDGPMDASLAAMSAEVLDTLEGDSSLR